ncbi:MAG: P-II family nitrogen regulator [Thermoanaerobacter sp.]|nr:P-II family nitrogen regulator [Thermoanaerobacter sp.]
MNAIMRKYKLLVAVVNYGVARKAVKAAKQAGAEGGTTLLGEGTGGHKVSEVLGIDLEPEKEIILILIDESKLEVVLQAVISAARLDKSGRGIAFVLDVSRVAGICHLGAPVEIPEQNPGGMEMVKDGEEVLYDLIVTIVNKGDSEKVVDASKRAGAEGGTILFGRGTGIHENARLFGIPIEPEKEIVLTLIERQKSGKVLEAIINETDLNKPGKGIAFVLEVERVAGINRQLNRMVRKMLSESSPR